MATITKRGKSWAAQIRRKGHPSRSRSFRTKQAATKWAIELESRLLSGRSPGEGFVDPSMTLGSLVRKYVQTVTPSKRSKASERYRLEKLLRDPVCETRLAKLTSADIAAYRDRRASVVGAGTLCRELSLFNHMFDVARREWRIPLAANLVTDVSKPRLNNARTRRLREGEWAALCISLDRSRNPLMGLLVQLAVHTAMRRGELLDLRWSRINMCESTAHIPQTKTDQPRTIPLTPAALHVLEKLPRNGDTVFPFSANSVKLAWTRATKRAGIQGLRFHDLRHEAISRFFEFGLSMPEVALISGHKDPRMLFRYSHIDASRLSRKLKSLDFEDTRAVTVG